MSEPSELDVELLRQELLATRLPQHEHGGYEVTATDAFLNSLIDRVASLVDQNSALNRTIDRLVGERKDAEAALDDAKTTIERLEADLRTRPVPPVDDPVPTPTSPTGLPTAPVTGQQREMQSREP